MESPGWNTGAAFFDAEGDGDLDLYVASYIDCSLQDVLDAKRTLSWRGLEQVAVGPFGLQGAPDHFFRNEGGGASWTRPPKRGCRTAAWASASGFGPPTSASDGRPDLYVANDSDPNYLYRNEGGGVFKEVATWSGAALDENGAAQASMGLAVGDVDGDSVLDLFTTNFSEDFSTLYRGIGDGLFEDVAKRSGVGPATFRPLSWGTAFADFDNDGDLDLVVANGHIYPQIDRHPELIGTYAQRNQLLENRSTPGAPAFTDVTAEAGPGFEPLLPSRGLAVGDFDDDGAPDILISRLDAPPTLLRNESGGGSVAHRRVRGRARPPEPRRHGGQDPGRGAHPVARHRRGRLLPEHPRPPTPLRPRRPPDRGRGGRAMARREPHRPPPRPRPAVPPDSPGRERDRRRAAALARPEGLGSRPPVARHHPRWP